MKKTDSKKKTFQEGLWVVRRDFPWTPSHKQTAADLRERQHKRMRLAGMPIPEGR